MNPTNPPSFSTDASTGPTHSGPALSLDRVLALRPVVRFSRGANEGWIVRVGPIRRELRGRSTETLLPLVLEALEHEWSVAAVIAHLERQHAVDREVAHACLQKLYAWGFLDDVRGDDAPPPGDRVAERVAQARFFAQWTSHPQRAQRQLAAIRVALHGRMPGLEALRESIERSGPRVVRAEPGGTTSDLEIGWSASLGDPSLREAHRSALRAGVPFLAITQSGAGAFLGPLVLPGKSACLECAREHLGLPQSEPTESASHPTAAGDAELLAQLASIEVIGFGAPCMRPRCVGRQLQFGRELGALREVEILRRPRCRCCGRLARHSPSVAFRGRVGFTRG